MACPENLTPFTSEQSREKAAKNGRKGGIASGEAKRKKKQLRECIEYLLERVDPTALDENGEPMTGAEQLSTALFIKALTENDTAKAAKAFEVLRDTAGQKPVDKVVIAEVDQSVINEVESMINSDKETSS